MKHKYKVLIVEDEPRVAALIKQYAQQVFSNRLDFHPKVARNAQDFINWQTAKQFDIVFLDLKLQGTMGGEKALKHLHNQGLLSNPMAVIITSNHLKQRAVSFLGLNGFNNYKVLKPIISTDLKNELSKAISELDKTTKPIKHKRAGEVTLKHRGKEWKVNLNDIVFVEKDAKAPDSQTKVQFCYKGKPETLMIPFRKVKEELPKNNKAGIPAFFCTSAYALNGKYVQEKKNGTSKDAELTFRWKLNGVQHKLCSFSILLSGYYWYDKKGKDWWEQHKP